jgi:type II secretory pathway pseudopilin PulG
VNRGRDEGITLIEMVVSMSIMAIFLAMFTIGVVQMFHTANGVQANALAQSQVNTAFVKLDTELRYARWINPPHADAGGWYVEYLTTSSGTDRCTQLFLDVGARQLKRRDWDLGTAPPGAWNILAAGVTTSPSGGAPFTVPDPGPSGGPVSYQRLTLDITSAPAPGRSAGARQTRVTFSALNALLTAEPDDLCTAGG